MSDLHGCKHEFDEMLKQIEFSEYDTVYILGDIGDRGKESIPLLQEIMSHPNIHVIMGNHDAWLAKYCQELIEIKKDCNTVDMTDDFLCWLHYNGGYTTADQFMDLPFPDCYDIKVYLENIPYYKIIKVHGKKFVLIHAGLSEEYMSDSQNEKTLAWSAVTPGGCVNKSYYDAVYLMRIEIIKEKDSSKLKEKLSGLTVSLQQALNTLYKQNNWDRNSWPAYDGPAIS